MKRGGVITFGALILLCLVQVCCQAAQINATREKQAGTIPAYQEGAKKPNSYSGTKTPAQVSLPDFAKNPAKTITLSAGATAAQIQSAIDAVSKAGGGKVVLAAGQYNLTSALDLKSNVYLTGQGASTVINSSNTNGSPIRISSNDVAIGNFALTGHSKITVGASNVLVHDVTATDVKVTDAAFGIHRATAKGDLVENVAFVNCTAVRSEGHGFQVSGWEEGFGKNFTVKDITFLNCTAEDCGGKSSDNTSKYGAGFDLQEQVHVDGMRLENCTAKGNWEAGFYQEPNYEGCIYRTNNLVLVNCQAENNGNGKLKAEGWHQKEGVGLKHGAGFFIHNGATLTNCTSSNNASAGFLSWDSNYQNPGGILVYSGCKANNESRAGFGNKYGQSGLSLTGCEVDGRSIGMNDLVKNLGYK